MNLPEKGSKWKHLKTGNVYEVLGTGKHTENDEYMIVYSKCGAEGKLLDNAMDTWIRPAGMFLDGRFEKLKVLEPEMVINPYKHFCNVAGCTESAEYILTSKNKDQYKMCKDHYERSVAREMAPLAHVHVEKVKQPLKCGVSGCPNEAIAGAHLVYPGNLPLCDKHTQEIMSPVSCANNK